MIKLPLTEPAIRALLPHSADMCLIDSLLEWSPESALCQTQTHRRHPHPLAENGRLGSANLIEYAAQCMALHGALLAPPADNRHSGSQPHGVLAGVRKINLLIDDIQTIAGPLSIRVSLLSGDSKTAIYDFSVSTDHTPLADGRATVMFMIDPGSA